MANQGPFGGMILPFDYPSYYEEGEPRASVIAALQHPIMRRMYESLFKVYMMDEFMRYFGMEDWNTEFPLNEDGELNAEPRWMRQMGSLLLNHSIQKKGHECQDCHVEDGIMDFVKLGYTGEQVKALQNLPELKTGAQ